MTKFLILQWRTEKEKDTFRMKKQILRLSISGSVDDGKSTLLGRLLFDSKNLNQDDIEKIKKRSKIEGEIDFSLFTDGLKDEIEQGITIDVAYRFFSTKNRAYIVSDTPGHIQYTRNMITGSSLSNIMMILIDVKKGITNQTKRHLFISSLLNVNHIIICINKMDLISYDESIFYKIKNDLEKFTSKLILKDLNYIPISALNGDNIIDRSNQMNWYQGPTLMYILENLHVSSDVNKVKSRMLVQNVVRTSNNSQRFLQGKIHSGIFRKGDEIVIHPSLIKTQIKKIIYDFKSIELSYSPMSISIEVEDEIDISRGNLITKKNSLPRNSRFIEVMACWLSEKDINHNNTYTFFRVSEEIKCKITDIDYIYDIENLSRDLGDKKIQINSIFKCKVKLSNSLFFDSYSDNKETGSFILIDNENSTVACCMII